MSAAKTLAGAFGFRSQPPYATRLRVRVDRNRQFRPEWQAELDAMVPKTDNSSRLYGVWDAGYWWEPIHRFSILQLVPWHLAAPEERAVMSGPSPRKGAILNRTPERGPDGRVRWAYSLDGPYNIGITDSLCHDTHHHFRRLGEWVVPRRFWVIQGHDGGMPLRLSQIEARLWSLQGRAHTAPGDAPFAEFDQRVMRALRAYDNWNHVQGRHNAYTGASGHINRSRAIEMEANRLQWEGARAMNEQILDRMGWMMRDAGMTNLRLNPVGYKPVELDVDQVRDEFINNTTHQEAAY